MNVDVIPNNGDTIITLLFSMSQATNGWKRTKRQCQKDLEMTEDILSAYVAVSCT